MKAHGWSIGGIDAGERVRQQVDYEQWIDHLGGPPPTDIQIAMVLHALADHTALVQAVEWRPPEDGYASVPTSVGRWLHDLGDYMQERACTAQPEINH